MTTPTTPRWPRRFPCRALLALLGIATLPGDRALAQTDPDVETIVAAWNQHLSTLGCVKYVVEGTEFFPKDSIESGFPAEDFTAPRKMTLWIDFTTNRLRKEITRHEAHIDERVIRDVYSIQMYDGMNGWLSTPRDRNAERYEGEQKYMANLVKMDPRHVSLFLEASDRACLFAEAVVRPWRPSDPTLSTLVSAGDWRKHGYAERDGTKCVVLRPVAGMPSDVREVWVDVDKKASIVSYARIQGGEELLRLNLWYRAERGAWTLDRYEETRHGRRILQMKVLARELVNHLSSELVSVTPATGDVVKDVAADERYLVRGSQKLDVRELYLSERQRSIVSRWAVWGMASIVALLIISALMIRFKR